MMRSSVTQASTETVEGASRLQRIDTLAIEEPLEIRVVFDAPTSFTELLSVENPPAERTVSITMRTPGDDIELALGFLLGEGVIRSGDDVASVKHCGPSARPDGTSNVVRVGLRAQSSLDLARLERHFYMSSSCGVCGKTSLDAVRSAPHAPLPKDTPVLRPATVHALSATLRREQKVFDCTGGLHAAGLFDSTGNLVALREDVGRHNALDKLFGGQLLSGGLPASERVLLLSGRLSFELVQKATMAGVPVVAAVGAPSSLAVELAREEGMTVLGFVRDGRFNIYAGGHRIEEVPS